MEKRPRGRRVPPPTPEQLADWEVGTVSPDEAGYEQAWTDIEAHRTLEPSQIAVAVVQHRGTGHFHAVLSLFGTDCNTLGVYAQQAPAATLAADFGELFADWCERSVTESQALQEALMARGVRESVIPPPEWALPDDQVQELLVEIARAQQRRN
jgi:hypothetical protein